MAFEKDDDGLVTGVELTVLPMLPGKYACKSVSLVDERSAGGNTNAKIMILDKAGAPVFEKVYLAFPWDGESTTFANKALPGNTNYPVDHTIINEYWPPQRGPLALFVGDDQGNINSDVVAGLGLPQRRHVCYNVVYQERGTVEPELPVEPPDPGLPDTGPVDYAALWRQMADDLRALRVHLGA